MLTEHPLDDNFRPDKFRFQPDEEWRSRATGDSPKELNNDFFF